jgi:UDP-N-acetylmuramoyl-L-alanyl-D-glutamate--2,6-diaminopimelate ligase
MGAIASAMSDITIVTSDNPRTESPMTIIRAIEAGYVECGRASPYRIIADRAQAICEAIGMARRGDVVVIAGKGHETYQIVGSERIPFDDRQVAMAALQGLGFAARSAAPI